MVRLALHVALPCAVPASEWRAGENTPTYRLATRDLRVVVCTPPDPHPSLANSNCNTPDNVFGLYHRTWAMHIYACMNTSDV